MQEIHLNYGARRLRVDERKVQFLLGDHSITIEAPASFVREINLVVDALKVKKLERSEFFSYFTTENEGAVRKLINRGVFVESGKNSFADATYFHKISGTPSNFTPNLDDKSANTLLKARHNTLRKEVAEIPREFSYLRGRHSERVNTKPNVPLRVVEEIFIVGYGTINITNSTIRRTVPSAGAFYPLELFYLDFKTENLYYFDGVNLQKHRAVNQSELVFLKRLNQFTEQKLWAGSVLCFAETEDICKKYGPKGYVLTLLEAGHVLQNMIHAVERRSLASLEVGCLSNEECMKLVDFRKASQIYVSGMLLGGHD